MDLHLLACLFSCLLASPSVAQQPDPPPLRLEGVVPGGVRSSVTESWGTLDFDLTNLSDADRVGRVFVFDGAHPDVQYGRDVWVPAHSTMASWMLAGPAAPQASSLGREVQTLLYERGAGGDRLVLPPTEERVRSRPVPYRKRDPRDAFTAIMIDEEPYSYAMTGRLPQPDSPTREALDLVRTFRLAAKLSEYVQIVNPRYLPPMAEAFAGIDHLVLASARIAEDPAGARALRHWLERGGKLWVMLDLVDAEVAAPLLSDAFDFQVVDRVSLNTFKIETPWAGPDMAQLPVQEHERPVNLARVMLPAQERVRHTVNGWPAWFTRPVGRGKIIFTTLGPRAWYRPRHRTEPSPFENFPDVPVPTQPLETLADELRVLRPEESTPVDVFQPLLTEEIGYSVVSRGVVGVIFGCFLVATLALGLVLRRSRRPELIGWLASVAAVGATGTFIALGESSRRAVAPTVAVAQVVDAVNGSDEAAVHGLLSVYRPDSGPAVVGAEQGGLFEVDMTGLEGQTRRFVLTDLDSWHWENLELPAGVRSAPFRYTVPTSQPLAATARFGPEGLEGNIASGPFHDLADAIVKTPTGRNLALRLSPDGTFRAGSADILPAGQFLASAVLTDRQQRRQAIYRELLKRPVGGRGESRDLVMAWAEPIDMHFTLVPEARTVGAAFLVIPLRFERPAPGTRVTVPGPFIPYARIMHGSQTQPLFQAHQAIDMHLRFQLPAAVLPLQIEQARLLARVETPSRRVTIAAGQDEKWLELHRVDSPIDPIRIDLTDERTLRLDKEGGLHINLSISDSLRNGQAATSPSGTDEKWLIDFVELEVTGRTAP
jgi:hypothetical protein